MGGRFGTSIRCALVGVLVAACGRTGLYASGEVDGSAGSSGAGASAAGTGGSGGGGMAGTWTMIGPRPQPEGTCADPEDDSRFANGTTRFVATTPDCEGQEPCYATLASAVNEAHHGDTILLLPGAYAGATIKQAGTRGDLRITSRDGPTTTFIEEPCLFIQGPMGDPGEIWVDRLTFRKCGSSWFGQAISVASMGGVRVRIQDNVFVNAGHSGAIYVQTTQPEDPFLGVIARNRVLDHEANSPAVEVYVTTTPAAEDVSCARVENNLIANNRVGISYGRAEVVNNTITGNTRGGSMLPTEGGIVANNIFFANDMPDFSDELAVGGEFVSNLVDSGEFTGTGDNFAADPLFVDAPHGDYHVRSGSLAALAGDAYYAPLHDIDGVTWRGPTRGIGAFLSDSEPAAAPDGVVCGDGAIQYGPVTTNYGTYVGFETCENARGRSCAPRCQEYPRPSSGLISMLGKRLCAVRMDGSVSCWNVPLPTPAINVKVRQVAVSQEHVCALYDAAPEGAASVRCWRDDGLALEPAGTFTQIAGDYSVTCGLRTGGFTCWSWNELTLDVDGDFVRVDVNRRICALSPEGEPTCFDGTAQKLVDPPAGPFIQMLPSSETVCGLRSSGELVCPPSKKGFDIAPRAGFVHVDNESYATVGLRPDGRVLEWETSWAKLPETDHPFIDIVASSDFGCGLTADRRVSCWKDDTTLPHE